MIYLHTYILTTCIYFHEFYNNKYNTYHLVTEDKNTNDILYFNGKMATEHIITFNHAYHPHSFEYKLPEKLNIIEFVPGNRLIQLEHSKLCISLNSL